MSGTGLTGSTGITGFTRDDEQGSRPVRVAVVDDHPVFRLGMVALLSSLEGVEVVAQASSAAQAAALGEPGGPQVDVVVMDLELGDGSGVDVTRDLVRRSPGTGVLVMTMHEDDDSVIAAVRAGARGYLLKAARPDEVERAVRAVANGEVILGPAVVGAAIGYFSGARTAALGRPLPFPELTDREREVLDQVARGLDNGSIARRLLLSEKTVRNNLATVLAKLALRDRAAAVVAAREAGLGLD